MSALWDLLDDFVLGPFNVIDRVEGIVSGIRYRDMGHRFCFPRTDKGAEHCLVDIERMLNKYGVVVYGRTHDARNMYFLVKKRQAAWAEYLMLHMGVDLIGPRVDTRNPGYAAKNAAELKPMPKPWSERKAERKSRASARRRERKQRRSRR